ncbi:DUF6456 domain-containing protein [Sphingomonas sp. CFBP 13706]|uniref:DUF6456 domain-containing protein n=1 Tax=Sphingomonas sp. CFBP 13706 TaxID=2775314 RepID=UPI00406CB563
MQDLIEVAIDGRGMRRDADREGDRVVERDSGREVHREGVTRGGRSVTVNRAESPLTWLRSRGLIDARQFAAGERLRAAYETASLAPSVTMRWTPRVDGGGHDALDPTAAQIAAKRRFDAAIAAAGPGLADILWRVVCAGEGLPAAERALSWPARAGRLVLTLALDRLATHYEGGDVRGREGGGGSPLRGDAGKGAACASI